MSVTITISPPQSLDDAGQLSRVKGRVMDKKKTEGDGFPTLQDSQWRRLHFARLTLQLVVSCD